MVYIPEKVEIGDILAYDGTDFVGGIIGWFTANNKSQRKSHIAGVCEIYPDHRIIEAHMATDNDDGKSESGVIEKKLNPKWYNNITVLRVKGGLDKEQKKALIEGLKRDYVGKVPYDLGSFPSIWFCSRILKPMGFGDYKPMLNNDKAVTCGNLWAIAYEKYLGIDLFPKLYNDSTSPADFMRCDLLYKVC